MLLLCRPDNCIGEDKEREEEKGEEEEEMRTRTRTMAAVRVRLYRHWAQGAHLSEVEQGQRAR